jgi:hypothetical protein
MSALSELREAIDVDMPVADSALLVGAAALLDTQDEVIVRLVAENRDLKRRIAYLTRSARVAGGRDGGEVLRLRALA